MASPLQGIRVIDWTIWQQGPQATSMLGDLGAEVIKIELRATGETSRNIMDIIKTMADIPDCWNYYFEYFNRNKKSLTLDLKKTQAREIIYRLVEKSDVFVQNFRKGVPERLGLDYKTLTQYNSKIIYATASGYGPVGPDSGEPSFDYMGLARSGIMSAVGEPGQPPMMIRGAIADQMGAIMLSYTILVALLARERLGIGQEVHTSHLGSMMALQGLNVATVLALGQELPIRSRKNAGNPLWNHYVCGDGKWICLGMLESDRYWGDFCRALGIQRLEKDPRFDNAIKRKENSSELISILDEVFASESRSGWLRILKESGDFIYTVVNTMADLANDPQALLNDYIIEYKHPQYNTIKSMGFPYTLSETPAKIQRPSPELNEHCEEILTEIAGYSQDEVAEFIREEVV